MKRQGYLYIYAAALTVAGLGLLISEVSTGLPSAIFSSSHFWLLAGGVIVGEFVHIKVPHREETVTVTVGDPFTLALLFTFGIGPAMVVKAIATLSEDIYRRKTWWKAIFNVGQFSLSLGLAAWIFSFSNYTAMSSGSLDVTTLLLSLVASFTYFLINMIIVTTAISLAIGERTLATFKSNLHETGVVQQLALTGFTPVVTSAVHDSGALFPLLLIPIFVVYRSGQLVQRHVTLAEQLRALYETTRITSTTMSTRDSVKDLLQRVCNMFDASSAVLTFLPSEDEQEGLRTILDEDSGDFRYQESVRLDPTKGLWARVVSENEATLLPAPIENARLKDYFDSLGVEDVMAAPLRSEDGVNGVLEVYNRRAASSTFSSDDLHLFETLTNHASVAIANTRLIEQLEASLSHLTEMNRLKDDFVASVSHELRTPLTSIRGYVRTLLRPDVDFPREEQQSFLETIDRQSTRLHRLIEDLLAVSRIESQAEPISARLVDLPGLITDVTDEVRDRIDIETITVSIESSIPPMETDAGKLHQVISNLVDNAIKYGGKDSPIRIDVRSEAEGVCLSVTDSGPGVPLELQDQIFDRFYQVDQSATRAVGGAGLGLYICRRMAEAIGGRIWLERSSAEGSTFSVWVPLRPRARTGPDPLSAGSRGWKI